jgi:hypothetical protein
LSFCDFCTKARNEVRHRNITLYFPTARVDTHRLMRDIIIAHYQNVWNLAGFRIANSLA